MSDVNEDSFEELLRRVARTPDVSNVRRRIVPGLQLAGRFDIAERLGSGGMGHVFAAYDRMRQTRVALKVLGEQSPRSIVRLKREFRAAAELVHPNLVRLHELFSDGLDWFFTMDLVEGVTLPELLPKPLPPEKLRDVFRQLAFGLRALHAAQTLHADLRPSNFLITREEGRVILLYFGLARPIGPSEELGSAGTPAYMAPEQALGQPLDEAADWYAFGVVLYEALTGTLPLRKPASERLRDAPADLRQLCLELLRLAPEQRPTGDEVLERIGASGSSAAPRGSIPPPSRRALIGRQRELEKIEGAIDSALRGKPTWVLVHGPSGIGKTALGMRAAEVAAERGMRVLRSVCRERESIAYKAVDGLVDDLVAALDSLGEEAARALLPADIAELTLVLPALQAAEVVGQIRDSSATADHGATRFRAVAAFTELVQNLAQRGPLAIWIDDLQWSDAESALLLGPLLASQPPLPLLFLGGHRSSSSGRGRLLDSLLSDPNLTLARPIDVALGPLDPEDAEKLARSYLDVESQRSQLLARNVGRDAWGHPLFIAELAHALSQGEAEPSSRGATTLSDLIARRVAELPLPAREVLGLAAVAGAPLQRGVLKEASERSFGEVEEALDLLKANRLARSEGLRDEDAVDIHHDRIREIILQGIHADQRRTCHLRLANVLEAREDVTPDVLASHYQGAGELSRAGRYWNRAAEQAFRSLAFDHAADLFERALSQASFGREELLSVSRRRAEALAHAGKGAEAAEVYLRAAELCWRGDEAIELKRRAAEQLLLSGHLERGESVIEQVLELIGMQKTRSGRRALASLAVGRVLVRFRGLGHVTRDERDCSATELARLDASWTIACSFGVLDPIRGADFQSRHLLLALRVGEPRRLLRAMTLEASYAATSGLDTENRTVDVLSVADQLAQGSGDNVALGFLCVARGVATYLQGRPDRALSDLEEALDILTKHCPGAVWETVTARRFVIASLFFLGRFRRLRELVPPLLARAEATGNRYATMCFRTAYSWAAWLAEDDVAEAERQLRRAGEDWKGTGYQLSHCNVLIGTCYLDLYRGELESVYHRLLEDWPKIERAQLLRIGVLRVQLWQLRALATALRAAALVNRGQAETAAELRREARRMLARLDREQIGRAAPLALLVGAVLDLAEGDRTAAVRDLRRAIWGFDIQKMALFAAAARARLAPLVDEAEGAELRGQAAREFERERIVNPARLLDMLAPGFAPAGAAES